MKYLLTWLLAGVIFGLGTYLLGSNAMFWLGLAWLTFLIVVNVYVLWKKAHK